MKIRVGNVHVRKVWVSSYDRGDPVYSCKGTNSGYVEFDPTADTFTIGYTDDNGEDTEFAIHTLEVYRAFLNTHDVIVCKKEEGGDDED